MSLNKTEALTISNVTKIYKDKFMALDDISFHVNEGDFFALLGPNGAGKSTTLGIISSIVNKTSGQVKIFGEDTAKNPIAARKLLGVMPQEINLNIFEKPLDILLTQAGYFGIQKSKSYPYAKKLLQDMALWDKKDTQVRFLSGGMKRRLMVARALIHKPKLLILDEPTAGVDVELRQSLWELITKLHNDGLTIILTTHYLDEAENMCNRIALINKGKIHTNMDMKELLRSIKVNTFVLDLKDPITFDSLSLKLGTLKKIDQQTVEITVIKDATLNDLFAELTKHNIEALSIKTKTNRLEQFFIKVANTNKTKTKRT